MLQPKSFYPLVTQQLTVPIKNASWTATYPPKDSHLAVPNLSDPNQVSPGPEPAAVGGTTGLSEIIEIGGSSLVGIGIPAAWTAAVITFMVTFKYGDDTVFNSLRHADGSEYTITVAAGQTALVNYLDFVAVDRLQVRSGTFLVPVQQAADRLIELTLTRQISY